ncbi:sphingosine 1-phosphate receptor 5b [Trichomycterus rosablanca]|uniref:sphingosine 1-phosphate receptor 5b n=1 Tax=Trichomycterus rosablanca TaxID=2290929 RepID=UPI002F35C81E
MTGIYQYYHNNTVLKLHYEHIGKKGLDRYKNGIRPDTIALLLICVLIVLENAIVLVAIWKNKKFHLPMYYLLGNLALSDLLAGFTYMVNIIMSGPNTLKLTPVLWFVREGGVFITLVASIISLLAIAIERHITMVKMKPYHGTKRNRMFTLIGASWALSVLLGVLPIMGWNCVGEFDLCSTVLPLYAKSYNLFCVTVFIVILLSIVILYGRIFHTVKRNTKRLDSLRRKSLIRRSQKYMALLKTVTIVLGVFIACWMPIFFLLLLDFVCKATECPILLQAQYFLGVAMINSLINPIIYTLTSKDMRKAILKLLCHRCLITEDGQVRKIGVPFLECSLTKTETAIHRGLETTISSGNGTSSPVRILNANIKSVKV